MPKKKTLLQGVMDHDPRYIKGAVYVEPKLDGWGTMFLWVEGEVKAFTHTGNPLELPTQCKQVAEVLPKGFFFHAELTHPEGWQKIKSAIAYDPDSLIVNIFDMVSEEFFISGVDLRGYSQRKNALYNVLGGKDQLPGGKLMPGVRPLYTNCLTFVNGMFCESAEEITAAHSKWLDEGHEGSVIKRPNGLYNLGKTTDWLRMKPVPTQDCEIVEVIRDIKPGEHDHCQRVKALRVLDEKGVSCKVPYSSPWITHIHPTSIGRTEVGQIAGQRDGDGFIGMIIEVAYSRLTEAGRMREPRFVRFREDKTDGK